MSVLPIQPVLCPNFPKKMLITSMLLLPMGVAVTTHAMLPTIADDAAKSAKAKTAKTTNAKATTADAVNTAPEAIPNSNPDSNYQYPVDKQSLANQFITPTVTMAKIDNFDKPVAKLNHKTPVIGYNKAVDEQINGNILGNNAPSATSNTLTKTQMKQQVQQQLTEVTADPTAANTTTEDNSSADAVSKHQNAAQQTEDIKVTDVINPNDYLPDYKAKEAASVQEGKTQKPVASRQPNVAKNLYNRLFNRGAMALPKAKVTIVNADKNKQPALNIKNALEEVTVEAISDFPATLPRLRQIAREAAEAVGYYNTELSFKQRAADEIIVTVDKVGEPVKVNSRFVEIRGEGGKGENSLPVYEAIENEIPPQQGNVFNHGTYKASKATIEGIAKNNGYFDAKWLDSSVDVILPDNTAEVNLIYDTQQRYKFDDVKVYSIDKKGNITDDPDKLPIKPKLLKQLMTYQKGDPYFQPYVTQFSNNLQATRYFNGIDVDVVLPPEDKTAKGTVNFNNSNEAATPEVANEKAVDTVDGESLNNTNASNKVLDPTIIAPVNFSVDADTKERLSAVKQKAHNLLNAPEDLQLSKDQTNNSKNPLVVVANAVSKLAKKIDSPDDNPILLANANQADKIQKMTPDQVEQAKSVPTYVVLNATKSREAQAGIGYETDVGVRVVGKLNNNLVNRNGLQAGITVAASKDDQQVELNVGYPYKHPLDDRVTGTLGYEHKKNVDDLNSKLSTDTLHAGIARNIKSESGWNRIYSLRYRYDNIDNLTSVDDRANLPPPFNNYDSNVTQQALLAGYALNRTVTDNSLNPTKGYSQRYSIEVGGKGLLTDTNMAILRAGVKGIYSFGEDKKHQVLGSADLGYIYSDDFTNVPYKLRFFAGGDQSIRGYSTDSLAPTSDKFLVGGNALATGSVEYNYQFRPNFRGALFTDFGNAYDLDGKYDNSTKVGVGTGIRWASPIGLVRLDVAAGVSDDGTPIKVYLFIGTPL